MKKENIKYIRLVAEWLVITCLFYNGIAFAKLFSLSDGIYKIACASFSIVFLLFSIKLYDIFKNNNGGKE